MADGWQSASGPRKLSGKVRVSALAERQAGRIGAAQLAALHVSHGTVHRWVASAFLIRRLPRVYAVGHAGGGFAAELFEAVLYAGPGAGLTAGTALHLCGVTRSRPARIQVATPRRCRSLANVVVHPRRAFTRSWHDGLPLVPIADALLDYAVDATEDELLAAIGQAEYLRLLDAAELYANLERGRPGGAALRATLKAYVPQIARTRSRAERRLLKLCREHGIELPDTDVLIDGILVDAVWHEQRVVVEIDGIDNHHTPAQIRRDHRRDMRLRALGFVVLRYTEDQLLGQAGEVAAEVTQALSSAERWAAPGSR